MYIQLLEDVAQRASYGNNARKNQADCYNVVDTYIYIPQIVTVTIDESELKLKFVLVHVK